MLSDIMSFSSFTEDVNALSDAEVLARSKREPELFALIVRRYEAPLLRRARVILFSPEDAEEAVQGIHKNVSLRGQISSARRGKFFFLGIHNLKSRCVYKI